MTKTIMIDEEDHHCDFCGENQQIIMDDCDLFYAMCLNCRSCGPTAPTATDAFIAWCTRVRKCDDDRVFFMAKRLLSSS